MLSEDEKPRLVNSTDEFDGMGASEGAQAIVAKLAELGQGQFSTEYKLRDWLVSR